FQGFWRTANQPRPAWQSLQFQVAWLFPKKELIVLHSVQNYQLTPLEMQPRSHKIALEPQRLNGTRKEPQKKLVVILPKQTNTNK
ncbi:hypothetical protein E2320_011607, partial [Naja naja]